MPETFNSTSPNDDEISGVVENGFMFNNDCGYLGVGPSGVYTVCITETGGIWQAVISSLCTMEDRAVDIL